MKRTPLVRKTPLKRATKCTLRKSKLKPMSRGKSLWMALYKEACSRDGKQADQDRHHPMGRVGEYLLCYVVISKEKHREIHDRAKWARDVGWILSPFDGRPYEPTEYRAWWIEQEYHWPAQFKRPIS